MALLGTALVASLCTQISAGRTCSVAVPEPRARGVSSRHTESRVPGNEPSFEAIGPRVALESSAGWWRPGHSWMPGRVPTGAEERGVEGMRRGGEGKGGDQGGEQRGEGLCTAQTWGHLQTKVSCMGSSLLRKFLSHVIRDCAFRGCSRLEGKGSDWDLPTCPPAAPSPSLHQTGLFSSLVLMTFTSPLVLL